MLVISKILKINPERILLGGYANTGQPLLQVGPPSVGIDILHSFHRYLYVDRQFLLVIGMLG